MQINNEFAPVMKSSAQMETNQASIAMTPHMFQILSAGIYQHPERAVVRELSCNAYDAQVAAGNATVPFKVHLPSQLEPYFEVRDFGTGMTHEQVMKLYLTYGASTKRDTNDQIGGLGIGSKSPFAVAQSFTVTSFKDGTVRRYSIYMEEGVPQVTKLTESATTEPNGVAVRVAIPNDKLAKFREEATRIYTHFPVKPDCNATLPDLYAGLGILSESAGEFKVFSGVNHTRSIDTGIVMGNIEYPIDLEDVMPDYVDIIPDFLRRGIHKALIYMPIGSVNIAASRESLQLTDNTKAEIKRVFEQVSKEIMSKFQDKVDTASNLFEAIKIYREATGAMGGNAEGILRHITFDNKTLEQWRMEQDTCRSHVMIDPQTGKEVLDWHGKPKRDYTYPALIYYRIYHVNRHSDKRLEYYQANDETQFSLFRDMKADKLEKNVLFVISDRFQKNGSPKTVGRVAILREIAAKYQQETNESDGMMFVVDSQSEIDELFKLHHYPVSLMRVYKMSDYEYAYVPKKIVRGQVKLWKSEDGCSMEEVKVSLDEYDEPQYYIKAEGQDLVSNTLRDVKELSSVMRMLSKIVPTKTVLMFRKTVWNKIPEDWIEVDAGVIHKAVKDNPHWYIELNRSILHRKASSFGFNLDRMNMTLKMQFDGLAIQNGYASKGTEAINLEDNLETFEKMFGRPQIVLADIFYLRERNNTPLLEQIIDIMPSDDKLRIRVKAASERARQRFDYEKKRAGERNKLISWIDWYKVSVREVAEHLGYTLTPYIEK